MEGELRLVIQKDLLLQINGQGLLTITDRQRQFPTVGLSRAVSHIRSHHKGIEHRIGGLWQFEWHLNFEVAVLIRHGLAIRDPYTLIAIANSSRIPVAAIRPPPECCAAHDLISNICFLNWYPCITHGRALHLQCVTRSIGLCHLREIDMERRPLILLDPETIIHIIHLNRIGTRQSG